jgi:hypothetical protein
MIEESVHHAPSGDAPIKVAFWYDRPIAYSGGLNYVRNLLYAIALVNRGRVQPFLFLGTRVSERDLEGFATLATIVRTPILDRRRPGWFANRLLVKTAGVQWLVKRELRKHHIDVVSHAEHATNLGPSFRVVDWYPDFQFLHLPELFPGLDAHQEIRRLRSHIARADAIVLSSHAAFADFLSIAPESSVRRARVLQFVSQPNAKLSGIDHRRGADAIERRYGIKGRYFYLPNQFWVHKNHWVVFKAVAEMKAAGTEIAVVCTGNPRDYRTTRNDHVDSLKTFIAAEKLENNIMILGLIPYEDVLSLMHNCVAVINPSRFEGWSSTVEEAKSIGKRLALSSIPVHREQNPADARYFDPDDVPGLCSILQELWNMPPGCDEGARERASASLLERTREYGEAYIDLVQQVQLGHLRHD